MGKTIIEKIIANHSEESVNAGDITIVDVDATMATDTTAPLAIKSFEEMGGEQVQNSDNTVLVIDHASPPPNEQVANLQARMRSFSREQNTHLYDIGEGIGHQIMIDHKHVRPGQIVFGADSHTVTHGALGAFATGVGSTDLAGIWLTGQTWVKVPETIKIEFEGKLQPGVTSKDIILYLVGKLGISGATYQSIEYSGSATNEMSLASRMTLANMSIEMGAKAGFVDTEGLVLKEPFEHIQPDEDAKYSEIHKVNVSELQPQISIPHSPDQVVNASYVENTPIQQGFIGSCTNGRLEDLQAAAKVLDGKKIHPNTRLLIAPASKQVLHDALEDGTFAILTKAGATFLTSGCGPCVGTHMGIPADEENIISSSNRNFMGRMGNSKSNVYLGSPSVVARSVLHGML
ncbi:3-isopropylmalate dehydratase large subunit [Natribacillus halophilus]|uniref:aconitate hydratase n=1 Tax=Natribacillus halophilus TaxID=549003 RepID=A0A1G8SCG7_9BACI|nr:3-isopropylmalate dehydratase large subunit [Natribacillus halophilus]SDJ26861.1 3-isopropylmalate/(R)-2-methylmalate dehydratase large subunit [Natribacillus halophilus]